MYWPNFSEKTFYKKISKARKVPSGVSCSYLQWTKHVGFKMFFDAQMMKAARRRQKKAAKHGLAPKVGDMVTIKVFSFESRSGTWGYECNAPLPMKKKIYCYFTQTATKIGKVVPHKKIMKLEYALFDINIVQSDLHFHNMGYLGKKLVCIDFDDISCGD